VNIVAPPANPQEDPFGEALFIISIPPDFQSKLAQKRTATITLIPRDNSIKAFFGKTVIENMIAAYSDDLLTQRLATQGLTREWVHPIEVRESRRESLEPQDVIDVTAENSSNIPVALLFLLAVSSWLVGGGMSLILDTTVGEKERETIETLLVTPSNRGGIVVGKMTVVFICLIAVMGLWLIDVLLLSVMGSASPALSTLQTLGPSDALRVLIANSSNTLVLVFSLLAIIVPVAVLINSLVMAGATMAANYREASLFLALIQLGLPATVVLMVFSLPVEVNLPVYGLPLLGSVAAVRDLFGNTLPTWGLIINFISTLAYGAGMIGLVAWLFNQEWSTTRGL
jgi:sodium transport system permease protein